MRAWREENRKEAEEIAAKMDDLGIATEEAVNTYMANFNTMGWINIDRFYKMPDKQMMTVEVSDPDITPEKAFIVFKNINSMLPLVKMDDGKYYRDRFPKNDHIKTKHKGT